MSIPDLGDLDLDALTDPNIALVVVDQLVYMCRFIDYKWRLVDPGNRLVGWSRDDIAIRMEDEYARLRPNWQWRGRAKTSFEPFGRGTRFWDIPPLDRIDLDAITEPAAADVISRATGNLRCCAENYWQSMRYMQRGYLRDAETIKQNAAAFYNVLPPRWRW